MFLCDEFIKTKVAMLTDRMNSKFQRLRFQLFTTQINGGVDEGCEVLVPSDAGALVPYQDANNAARINAGLEIIEVLSRHWDMTMPVFVDNAESGQYAVDPSGSSAVLEQSQRNSTQCPDSGIRQRGSCGGGV